MTTIAFAHAPRVNKRTITSELICIFVGISPIVIISSPSSFLRSSCNPRNITFKNSEESSLALVENFGKNCVRISFCD